jgi:hypothetical protein
VTSLLLLWAEAMTPDVDDARNRHRRRQLHRRQSIVEQVFADLSGYAQAQLPASRPQHAA